MADTIEIAVPIDVEAAPLLRNQSVREAVGRVVSRILVSPKGASELELAIVALKAEARANGLTDEDIDDELRIYNAERRSTPAA